jgi:hypothetical protein
VKKRTLIHFSVRFLMGEYAAAIPAHPQGELPGRRR